MQRLKPVRKIVYAKIWGLSEQGNKYNILHIKVSLEAIFLTNDSSNQMSFHLGAWELHDECFASISVEIIFFEHLQQVSYEKLNPGIFLQECVQPNASHVATMMTLWKIITVFRSSSWNFSSSHYVTYFVRQSLHSDFESSVSQNKLGKYTFLWF